MSVDTAFSQGTCEGAEQSRKVVAYVRVSSEEQRRSGAGLAAQRDAITREAERRGWEIVEVVEDAGYSAKDLRRPGINKAMALLDSGRADALVVAKLDRLSRSMLDFAGLMAIAQKRSWGIVALDVSVDTTTPTGDLMANVVAAFAQFERLLIGQRTKDALAAKKRQGVRLGRPAALPVSTVRRIKRERAAGKSYAAIADGLNADKVPTAHGGKKWWPNVVRKVAAQR